MTEQVIFSTACSPCALFCRDKPKNTGLKPPLIRTSALQCLRWKRPDAQAAIPAADLDHFLPDSFTCVLVTPDAAPGQGKTKAARSWLEGNLLFQSGRPGAICPKTIWNWLHIEFQQSVVVGRAGPDIRHGGGAAYLIHELHEPVTQVIFKALRYNSALLDYTGLMASRTSGISSPFGASFAHQHQAALRKRQVQQRRGCGKRQPNSDFIHQQKRGESPKLIQGKHNGK
jgi:hypothetical protein